MIYTSILFLKLLLYEAQDILIIGILRRKFGELFIDHNAPI